MLTAAEPHLERNVHPTVICRAFMKALDDAVEIIDKLAFKINFNDKDELLKVVDSCVATKLTRRFGMLIPVRNTNTYMCAQSRPSCNCLGQRSASTCCSQQAMGSLLYCAPWSTRAQQRDGCAQELAVDAVRQVMRDIGSDKREVEIKKYAKIEKIPGGAMSDCRVIDGVMFTKDVVSPDRMRRKIVKPRILLLDCPLEYKKGENQTAVELVDEADFAELLQQEEAARNRPA
jgi:T-complex protein 1 subunit gamma